MDASSRPALRAVESIVVPHKIHGRVVLLRDTQGVTDANAELPPVVLPVVAHFTGHLTCSEIARATNVPVEVVVHLASELERMLFLEGPTFRAARARVESDFADLPVRPATFAGGAYYGERASLERYIEQSCLGKANESRSADGVHNGGGPIRALVAPHIDPWRGAVAYGHAYGALAAGLSHDADTFVLFGTSHAPMREPFALCRKAFDTPLGAVDADEAAVDALARCATGFDPYADQFNHKREHSLEFQVVFLKALLKNRRFRIVPILAGLGAHQASGDDPGADGRVARFLDGVRELVEGRPGRVVVVAGADMAHVGPRFGDDRAFDAEERAQLERADRASLERATALDPGGFWAHVAEDLEKRRVCGLAPIWSLLRSVSGTAHARVLHYEQTVDREDGSIVSHAAVAYY
jgi:AmmeMemoRadiSam system protein B